MRVVSGWPSHPFSSSFITFSLHFLGCISLWSSVFLSFLPFLTYRWGWGNGETSFRKQTWPAWNRSWAAERSLRSFWDWDPIVFDELWWNMILMDLNGFSRILIDFDLVDFGWFWSLLGRGHISSRFSVISKRPLMFANLRFCLPLGCSDCLQSYTNESVLLDFFGDKNHSCGISRCFGVWHEGVGSWVQFLC